MTVEAPEIRRSDCIIGVGASDAKGYKHGHIHVAKNKKYNVQAHQFAYLLAYGPYPQGLVIRHKCDNPPCVNPEHLELGTAADNVRDMVERGRHRNQVKTHCPQGHEYTEENTHRRQGGQRVCRTCMFMRDHGRARKGRNGGN